jgi:hypothetical protein
MVGRGACRGSAIQESMLTGGSAAGRKAVDEGKAKAAHGKHRKKKQNRRKLVFEGVSPRMLNYMIEKERE